MEHSLQNHELLRYYTERGWCGRMGFGERPALIVVDLARAWLNPNSTVGSDLSAVVENVIEILNKARKGRIPIFFTTIAYEPNLSDAGEIRKKKLPHSNEFIRGTDKVELLPQLGRQAGEVLIVKQRPSAFFGTTLLSQHIGHKIDTLIITGCSTSGCIRATAESAMDNNFHVIVPQEAVGDRCRSAHEANLFDINARYADVIPMREVLDYLDKISA